MRFLFVEDDVNVAHAFADVATSLGHRVWVAHDGGTALKLAADMRFDAIFMDIGLPDHDGLQLCGFIRSAGPSASACIVAVTAKVGLDSVQLREFDGYLSKPVTPGDLMQAIKTC